MKSTDTKFRTVDEYLATLSPKTRVHMKEMRKTIRLAAPEAEEMISYNMPAFKFHGMLVYYATHKDHIGFYPVSSAIRFFKEELGAYNTSKGTIQFPIEKNIPVNLIKRIVKFRVKENLEKAKLKGKKGR